MLSEELTQKDTKLLVISEESMEQGEQLKVLQKEYQNLKKTFVTLSASSATQAEELGEFKKLNGEMLEEGAGLRKREQQLEEAVKKRSRELKELRKICGKLTEDNEAMKQRLEQKTQDKKEESSPRFEPLVSRLPSLDSILSRVEELVGQATDAGE